MITATAADFVRPTLAVGLAVSGYVLSRRAFDATADSVAQAYYFMATSVILAAALAAIVWSIDYESEKRRAFSRLNYAYFLEKGTNKASMVVNRFMSIGITDRNGQSAAIHLPLFRMEVEHLNRFYTSPLVQKDVVKELAVRVFAFSQFNKMADVAEHSVVGAVQSDSPAARQLIEHTSASLGGLLDTVAGLLEVPVPEHQPMPTPATP